MDANVGETYIPPIYASENEAVLAYQNKVAHEQDEMYLKRVVELPEGKFDDLPLPYVCPVENKDGEITLVQEPYSAHLGEFVTGVSKAMGNFKAK